MEHAHAHASLLEELSQVTASFIIGDRAMGIEGEAFYGHFFAGLVKQVSDKYPTLAIGQQDGVMLLHVNPEFWHTQLPKLSHRIGVLKHEILHLVFKHIFRHKDFAHKTLFNIAADLVVNQFIPPQQLPAGAVFLESFPDLPLLPEQPLEYYYAQLLRLSQEAVQQAESPESTEVLKQLLQANNANQMRHQPWQEITDMSNASRDMLEVALNQSLERILKGHHGRQFGNLPLALQRYLTTWLDAQGSGLDWRRILRLFVGSSRFTQVRHTLRRPSPRYGTTPGIKIRPHLRLLVAIDTSGSINDALLALFFAEIRRIWQQGAEIWIVECDTDIHAQYLYKGTLPSIAHGKGGTSFEQPIIFANTRLRPDALIYFTDAFGPVPLTRPYCPLLWVISPEGASAAEAANLPGRKVHLYTR